MRETPLSLREQTRVRAAPGLRREPFLRRHRITWMLAAGGAVLLAGVGAFGTGSAAPWALYPYWFFLAFTGGALGGWAVDRFNAVEVAAERLAARAAAIIFVVSVLMTPIIWVAAGVAVHGSWRPAKMLHLFPQALLVVSIFVALQLVLERGLRTASAPAAPLPWTAPADAAEPALLARLPERLKGARLCAVQAEDHYLRVHTDRGSDLILMRLADAADALETLDGARTHRSWWVARDAVAGADRGGGRATLRLVNGLSVPVSRSYAGALRRAGWF
jgi:hypothetical protein